MRLEIRQAAYSGALFDRLIAEAVAADGRFMRRLRDRWLDGSEQFDRPGELLLGAFANDDLVGVAGVSHDPYEPEDGLGRIRHVYVLAEYRGRGIGRMLVGQIIEHARKHFSVLRLHTSNPAAARLYDDAGFMRSAQGRETHRLIL